MVEQIIPTRVVLFDCFSIVHIHVNTLINNVDQHLVFAFEIIPKFIFSNK